MNTFTSANWKLLSFPQPQKLNPSISQLHHAAQFVAMVGNSLLPKADDDSQANMGWHHEKQALSGRMVEANQQFRAIMTYPTFELQLLDASDFRIARLPIKGQTKSTLLHWLKRETAKLGINPEELRVINHFSIPHHPTDDNAAFEISSMTFQEELASYRSNAHLILEAFAKKFESASPVRIWPHHFDSGTYIPLSFDKEGKEDKSIGLGFAIPSDPISELYFYVYFWSKEGKENLNKLPDLASNGIWITKEWKGAALKVSEVLKAKTAQTQYQLVYDFFLSAINSQLELIGATDFKIRKE